MPTIPTLSLHDALPISMAGPELVGGLTQQPGDRLVVARVSRSLGRTGGQRMKDALQLVEHVAAGARGERDRKSTRLNSSHLVISYAVFCLKKKKKKKNK